MSTDSITDATPYTDTRPDRPRAAETKPSHKTSELIAYVLTVIGVLVASAVVDDASDFGAQDAWLLVSLLTIGYMLSRGLAKSGTRADNR